MPTRRRAPRSRSALRAAAELGAQPTTMCCGRGCCSRRARLARRRSCAHARRSRASTPPNTTYFVGGLHPRRRARRGRARRHRRAGPAEVELDDPRVVEQLGAGARRSRCGRCRARSRGSRARVRDARSARPSRSRSRAPYLDQLLEDEVDRHRRQSRRRLVEQEQPRAARQVRARARRASRWPPESVPARWRGVRRAAGTARAHVRSRHAALRGGSTSAPTYRFSITVNVGKTFWTCGTKFMPRRVRRSARNPATSSPAKRTEPVLGRTRP